MFCDITTPDGKPFAGDPRYALKRMLKKAADMGYTMYVGPELEFFYFADSEDTELLDKGGYFDLTPLDVASDLRRDTVLPLDRRMTPVDAHQDPLSPLLKTAPCRLPVPEPVLLVVPLVPIPFAVMLDRLAGCPAVVLRPSAVPLDQLALHPAAVPIPSVVLLAVNPLRH
jgi:hypothetical protein